MKRGSKEGEIGGRIGMICWGVKGGTAARQQANKEDQLAPQLVFSLLSSPFLFDWREKRNWEKKWSRAAPTNKWRNEIQSHFVGLNGMDEFVGYGAEPICAAELHSKAINDSFCVASSLLLSFINKEKTSNPINQQLTFFINWRELNEGRDWIELEWRQTL